MPPFLRRENVLLLYIFLISQICQYFNVKYIKIIDGLVSSFCFGKVLPRLPDVLTSLGNITGLRIDLLLRS